jgi:hypothetical protein
MLLWALNSSNPYGYYVLLRWVCCAVFAYLAFQVHASNKKNWTWILGVTAAIYNPILPLHLTREIWSVVNIVTIGVAAASAIALAPKDAAAPLTAASSTPKAESISAK